MATLLGKKKLDEKFPITETQNRQGLWQKCIQCEGVIYNKEWEESLRVCPLCGYHYPLTALQRIQVLIDPLSFKETHKKFRPTDFLDFKYSHTSYATKLKETQSKTGLSDAVVTGIGKVNNRTVNLAVMDFQFLGGSMGSVVGEKIAQAGLDAIRFNTPFIMVCASGGARMQEGLTSLMQMAKTSAVISRLKSKQIPYIVILTDPTYGGVTASFAMLGDITISEPKALIGFAGARVIEQTTKQKLPEGFQTAEFLQAHGYIDILSERKDLKNTVSKILNYVLHKK